MGSAVHSAEALFLRELFISQILIRLSQIMGILHMNSWSECPQGQAGHGERFTEKAEKSQLYRSDTILHCCWWTGHECSSTKQEIEFPPHTHELWSLKSVRQVWSNKNSPAKHKDCWVIDAEYCLYRSGGRSCSLFQRKPTRPTDSRSLILP